MKKFLKYLLIVLIGVGVFDVIVSVVLDNEINKLYKTTITETYGADSDIAILGASRAIHHYNPKIINDSLKMSAHVYGSGGQNIYFHYIVLKSLIDNSNNIPKIVLLELSGIDVNDSPKWNTERLNILFPYFYSEGSVKATLTDVLDKKELFMLRISGLYRHNSKLITYLKNLISGTNNEKTTGYIPLKKIWNKKLEKKEEIEKCVDSTKLVYIDKFVELCKKENIALAFTISPNYNLLSNENWKSEVYKIARKNGIQVFDYEQDAFFLEHGELFNEPYHLNESGVDIYTSRIVTDLKNKLIN